MAESGQEAAALIDDVLTGLESIAKDRRAGRKPYRTALSSATTDYRERNREEDRRRIEKADSRTLDESGLSGQQLASKRTVIKLSRKEASDRSKDGRRTRKAWRRFLKAGGLAVDTLLGATKIGHALKELLELADVVLDSEA